MTPSVLCLNSCCQCKQLRVEALFLSLISVIVFMIFIWIDVSLSRTSLHASIGFDEKLHRGMYDCTAETSEVTRGCFGRYLYGCLVVSSCCHLQDSFDFCASSSFSYPTSCRSLAAPSISGGLTTESSRLDHTIIQYMASSRNLVNLGLA